MQALNDHGLTDYSKQLDRAVDDGLCDGNHFGGWVRWRFARPSPRMDTCGDHNSVLHWLLAYPPLHVVQAMLVMWGRLSLHPRLRPVCDWCSWRWRDHSPSCHPKTPSCTGSAASRGTKRCWSLRTGCTCSSGRETTPY